MVSSLVASSRPITNTTTDNAELCVPAGAAARRSRYLMARKVVIDHLRISLGVNIPSVQVHNFESVHSGHFVDFLEKSSVAFFMIHDGSLPTSGREVKQSSIDLAAKVAFRGLIQHFNKDGYNVALINQNEYRDSKVCFRTFPL